MDLEEQLKMATMTTTTVAEPVQQPVQQVVQTTTTAPITEQPVQQVVAPQQAPVQYARVQELQQPMQPVLPTVQESSGIQMIQLGQQFNTRPINVVKKLGVGEQIRFTVLNRDAFYIKYHFIDGLGKYACFSTQQHRGQCCAEYGDPKHRYVLPILVYPTLPNNPTTVLQGAPAELKVLPIWDDAAYETIFNFSQDPENQPVDFIAKGTDSFGRFSVVPQQNGSYRGQFAEDVKKAQETWNNYKESVPGLICKPMNEQSYMEMKARMQSAGPNNSANYNNSYNNYQNYKGIM